MRIETTPVAGRTSNGGSDGGMGRKLQSSVDAKRIKNRQRKVGRCRFIHPMKPTLRPPGILRLKLIYDGTARRLN